MQVRIFYTDHGHQFWGQPPHSPYECRFWGHVWRRGLRRNLGWCFTPTQSGNIWLYSRNTASTHLSRDEIQGIVLGRRPLLLGGPFPPCALSPHVSSKPPQKILCSKNKQPTQVRPRAEQSEPSRQLAAGSHARQKVLKVVKGRGIKRKTRYQLGSCSPGRSSFNFFFSSSYYCCCCFFFLCFCEAGSRSLPHVRSCCCVHERIRSEPVASPCAF